MRNLQNENYLHVNNIFSQITIEGDEFSHSHVYYEIFYILSGTITHVYNGVKTELKQGDLCIILPQQIHLFQRKKGVECAHRDILIKREYFEECCNFINPTFLQWINTHIPRQIFRLSLQELHDLETSCNNLNEFASALQAFHGYDKTLCIRILEKIIEQSFQHAQNHYPLWLNQLISRFQNHKVMKEGIPAILKEFHYNPSYICRTFKKFVGMSMSQYLLKIRLEYASILLQTSNRPITEIAYEAGFKSVPYFNKEFKKYFSITPSRFKKPLR